MIFAILFFLCLVLVGLRYPLYFAALYVLCHTKFLGFINIDEAILLNGYAVGIATANLAALCASLPYLNKIPRRNQTFMAFFLAFVVLGLTLSALTSGTDLTSSLVEAKHFYSIFFLLYLSCHWRGIERQFLDLFLALGLYLSMVEVVFYTTGLCPPEYSIQFSFGEDGLRVAHPTYILLALAVALAQSNRTYRFLFKPTTLLLVVGLLLSRHASLLVGAGILLLAFFNLKDAKMKFSKSMLVAISSVLLLTISAAIYTDLTGAFQSAILQMNVEAFSNSVSGRHAQNTFRIAFWRQEPFFGHGFIGSGSDFAISRYPDIENRFQSTFSVIDAGYLNVALYFGIIGGSAYAYLWWYPLWHTFTKLQTHTHLQIAMACFLLSYFAINVTWSVFTYSFGLLPAYVAVAAMLKSQKSTQTLRRQTTAIGTKTTTSPTSRI